MRDFTCWAQLSARPVRPLEQPEEQRRKNASSEKSLGNWYISNSGREVSPQRRRRRCRMAEPCLLVASLPSNQPVSPSAAGSVVPGEFLRSEYVDSVAPYPGRICLELRSDYSTSRLWRQSPRSTGINWGWGWRRGSRARDSLSPILVDRGRSHHRVIRLRPRRRPERPS